MEQQIQELVNSIKRDGIIEANAKKDEIIENAKFQAKEIISQSEKEAASIIEKAQREANVLKQSASETIRQASRDVILSLKKNINAQMDRLLHQNIKETLSPENTIALIVHIVKAGIVDPKNGVVEVDKKNIKGLEEKLRGELEKELKNGLVINIVPSVDVGFRISDKNGSSYYEFSDEEIGNLLSPYLNEAIVDILAENTSTK